MKKKRILSLLMALTLFISLLPHAAAVSARDFTDVSEDDWCYEYVDYVTRQGYFNGTTPTTFAPDRTMTRAMFVVVLSRYDGVDVDNNQSAFTDVEPGAWCAGAINWAAANGIVGGYGDGTFHPNAPVTRAQMCAIMDRFVEYYMDENDVQVTKTGTVSTLTDQAQIPSYAVSAVRNCQRWGLIYGYSDGTFRPNANSSRAHVAAVIYRLAFLLDNAEPVRPSRPSGGGGGGGGGATYYDVTLWDGSTKLHSEEVRSGRTYELPDWTKTGYTLQGWSLKDDGTVDSGYGVGDTITVTENIDLYSVWQENKNPDDLIGNAVEATKDAANSKFNTLKAEVLQAILDVNALGEYFTYEELSEIADAVRSMTSVSEVKHDQANRTVSADVSLNVTEGQMVSLIDRASDFASDLIEGGTGSLPSGDDLRDFLAQVRDRVEEITGIELTDQTLSEIRQQVESKIIEEGKEMWANFYDDGGYYTGDVTLEANGYKVTVDVDPVNKTTTLVGVDKTTAVKEMGLAIAKDMFQQMKDQSAGNYISDGEVAGTVTVTFSPSANEEYAEKTDKYSYVYEVSLNVTADSDGLVSYKFDDGNYLKLTVSEAIQTAYNDALMAAAGDITEDSGAKDEVISKVKEELAARASDIYNEMKEKLESYGIELTVTAEDLTNALLPEVPAWVDTNWNNIVSAVASGSTLAGMDNTRLVDAAWDAIQQDVPQSVEDLDNMIQDLIVDQLADNNIDEAWLVDAANDNKYIQTAADYNGEVQFRDEERDLFDLSLPFETAEDIDTLLGVYDIRLVGFIILTGDGGTPVGNAIKGTIIETAQNELVEKLNESETLKNLIGENQAFQDYLVYSALVSLGLTSFESDKADAYQNGAVLEDLDIETIATDKMAELLDDRLAEVDVDGYLDGEEDYQDKIDLLNSLMFPEVCDETFQGMANKLRSQTVADLVGDRGNSYVEKYLERILNALNRYVPEGTSIVINGVTFDKDDLDVFEGADTTVEALHALADLCEKIGDLSINNFAEPGIPVTVNYNSRTFNFNFVIEVA